MFISGDKDYVLLSAKQVVTKRFFGMVKITELRLFLEMESDSEVEIITRAKQLNKLGIECHIFNPETSFPSDVFFK